MSNKNMVKCKACEKDIAKGVKKCPHCGKDQRNFFARHKILTGILVVILIAAIGGATGGGDGEEPKDDGPKIVEEDSVETEETSDEEEIEEESEEEIGDKEFSVGEKVELDGQIVEVTDVEKSNGNDFDKPSEGKEFVIVHVSIVNNGDDEISYNPFNFKMQNSDGQIESQGFTIVDSDTSLSSGDLAPEGNVSGTIAFEQPIDDDGLKLIFEPGFWDNEKVVFNISE